MKERILYESEDLIAVDKLGGEPVVKDLSGDIPLSEKIAEYEGSPVFPLHRIDRPVSGVVLFAKNREAAAYYSKVFKNRETGKIYLAATENCPSRKKGELNGWIKVSPKRNKAYYSEEKGGKAKNAETRYAVIDEIDRYFLIALQPETGRHHQLRAQLSFLGCPVKGDVKYGARRKNKDRAIHLHAWSLSIGERGSREILKINAPLPDDPVWNAFDSELLKKPGEAQQLLFSGEEE